MTGWDVQAMVHTAPRIFLDLRRRKKNQRVYRYGLIRALLNNSLYGLAIMWRYPGEGMPMRPMVGIVCQWRETIWSTQHIMFCVAGKWRRYPKGE